MAITKKVVTTKSNRDANAPPPVTTRSLRAPVAPAASAPMYEIVERETLIENAIHPVGARPVVYYGLPGRTLKPINDAAKDRKRQVRSIRLDEDLTAEQKAVKLLALSDLWNGVESDDPDYDKFDDEKDEDLTEGELTVAEKSELERQALASVKATADKEEDNTNLVRVQLQGKNEPDPTSLQGATPTLDTAGK